MKVTTLNRRLEGLETAQVKCMDIDAVHERLRRYERFFAGETDTKPWPELVMTEELERYKRYLEEIDE